jgi:hypothetical protein
MDRVVEVEVTLVVALVVGATQAVALVVGATQAVASSRKTRLKTAN